MRWEEVCADPGLQNLPYKIELDRLGKLIMSPAKNRHSIMQGRFQRLLWKLLGEHGEILPECAVQTSEGVKVADVAWLSPERYQQVKAEIAYRLAPELCIEIRSAVNSDREMRDKIRLYLAAGAREVWICDEAGNIRFHGDDGELAQSRLVPDFPRQLTVD